jgi:hypothetical protein
MTDDGFIYFIVVAPCLDLSSSQIPHWQDPGWDDAAKVDKFSKRAFAYFQHLHISKSPHKPTNQRTTHNRSKQEKKAMSSKKYDIILFGVTGFTGKLAAEYLLHKTRDLGKTLSWAVSARNAAKAESVLQELVVGSQDTTSSSTILPDILVADLECPTPEDRTKLQEIVQQTKVVLTCSGPFEKYGPTLVELCAQFGVYYADITGESDYFRQMIEKYDRQAQETGAAIVFHCGHDCIPCDLLVWEMNHYASQQGYELKQVLTYQEFSEEFAFSGGTAATAAYQLSKDRTSNAATTPSFDPLMTAVRNLSIYICCHWQLQWHTANSFMLYSSCFRKRVKNPSFAPKISVPKRMSKYPCCQVASLDLGSWHLS